MSIRMVAIDLDGTLLNSRSTISPANLEALREARRRGVEIVIVTGRRYQSAQKVMHNLGTPVTLITSNGAMVRSAAGDVLHRNFLPRSTARRVLEVTPDYRPYAVVIFDQQGRGQVTMEDCAISEGPLAWYQTHSPDHLQQIPSLTSCLDRDPIQLMFGGPPDRVAPLEPHLQSSFSPQEIHLTWTKYLGRNLSILDVMNGGCTKGNAVAAWAKQMQVDSSQVVAVGDNFNDLEMLQFAGVAVVMANSTPGLARKGWETTSSNDEDGLARAVEKHVLAGG